MKKKVISDNFYSQRKKILMWFVFIGIFVCGMMAGAFLWQSKNIRATNSNINNENVDTCVRLEEALLENIRYNINNAGPGADDAHEINAKIYDRMAAVGCPEHAARYKEMAESERKIADNLRMVDRNIDEKPCMVIERNLQMRIKDDCWDSPRCYIDNAEIYSKMAEDGCPENKDVNTRKALDELQIAEGVRVNEENIGQNEIRSAINTYKKLQMQNEAKKYLNKVEKMINPGIDFILELQKVIEE